MSYNIKVLLAYEGTDYLGWQKTAAGPSIEGELEPQLQCLLGHPIRLQAASRTDAGVHAEGQVVNFRVESLRYSLRRLQLSLNQLLPSSIRVLEIEEAPLCFHPTLDAKGKEYRYLIDNGPVALPRQRHYSWHQPFPLGIDQMRQAAALLIGTNDYYALCNRSHKQKYRDTIRSLEAIELLVHPERQVELRIRGSSFLYKMVRNIAGLLVSVGLGKKGAEEIPRLLASGDRTLAGVTAPAAGLTLHRVFY